MFGTHQADKNLFFYWKPDDECLNMLKAFINLASFIDDVKPLILFFSISSFVVVFIWCQMFGLDIFA